MSAANNTSPSIEQACRAITALLTKLEHGAKKITQYQCAIGQHIAAIKKARPDDWLRVVETECGLKRRRAYSFLALVNGTETVTRQRAANAAANKRLRQRQRASRDAQNPSYPKMRDDIGPASAGEVARKDIEIEELRSAKRRLEIKVAGLESEIEELKHENAALRQRLAVAQADPGPIPEFLARKPAEAPPPERRP